MLPNLRLTVLAAALVLPVPALAYHPLITDDTGTQGTGGNQLELGYDHVRADGATGRGFGATYTRGITETLDLFLGSAWQASSPKGWGNVGVGAKWRFYEDEAAKLSVGLKPEILLPVSRADEAAGLGNGKTSYGVTLLVTRETAFGALHANVELARANYADASIPDRRNFWRVSVAPVWQVGEHWKLALDLGLQTNPDRSRDAAMGYVELGVLYSPDARFDLSLGLIRELMDGPADTTTATVQLTWHF